MEAAGAGAHVARGSQVPGGWILAPAVVETLLTSTLAAVDRDQLVVLADAEVQANAEWSGPDRAAVMRHDSLPGSQGLPPCDEERSFLAAVALPPRVLRHRTLATQRVRHCAPRDTGPAGDLTDVHGWAPCSNRFDAAGSRRVRQVGLRWGEEDAPRPSNRFA